MTKPRELSCSQYVTVAYERVRDALQKDAAGILDRASNATLHAEVGPFEIGAEVSFDVRGVSETISALGEKRTVVNVDWAAAHDPGLFPTMEATLSVTPLSRSETQLELLGQYRPPLGPAGNLVDAIVGHRVAQASVLRFVQEVAALLKTELGA